MLPANRAAANGGGASGGGASGGGVSGGGADVAALSETRLRAMTALPGGMWADIRVLAETGSTNQDALELASDGSPEGLVIAAETQTAGRGRQGRAWLSPPAALTFSVLLRPPVPRAARGWVPLLAGVAAASALRDLTGVDARLKWPNDVLVDGAKLAGILAEQSGDAIVVGIGINVLGSELTLPVAMATSLESHGAGGTDRTELLAGILRELEHWYLRWRVTGSGDADASGLRSQYLRLSSTVGRPVNVKLPGGRLLTGVATDIDALGQLLVRPGSGDPIAVSAGDVLHVRLSRTPI